MNKYDQIALSKYKCCIRNVKSEKITHNISVYMTRRRHL